MREEEKAKDKPSFNQVEAKDVDAAFKNCVKVPAMCFTPFFRKKPGDRFYKLGVLSLVLMAAFLNSPLMPYFMGLWILFLLASGINKDAHSEWGGFSRLGERMGRFLEPGVVAGGGLVCAAFDETFALFCFIGAASMFCVVTLEWQMINKLKRDMRDAGEYGRWVSRLRR